MNSVKKIMLLKNPILNISNNNIGNEEEEEKSVILLKQPPASKFN